jgi:hypothetical protein
MRAPSTMHHRHPLDAAHRARRGSDWDGPQPSARLAPIPAPAVDAIGDEALSETSAFIRQRKIPHQEADYQSAADCQPALTRKRDDPQ